MSFLRRRLKAHIGHQKNVAEHKKGQIGQQKNVDDNEHEM